MNLSNPDLSALLRPQSVAVIGASTNQHKVGGVPVALLSTLGFAGRVVPVHPDAREIQGIPAVKSILDALQPVETAVHEVNERLVSEARDAFASAAAYR